LISIISTLSFLHPRSPSPPPLFPYTTLFRSVLDGQQLFARVGPRALQEIHRFSFVPIPRLRRLTLRTVSPATIEGNRVHHQALAMYMRPSLIWDPHSGSGGTAPKPRKLNEATARIAPPRSMPATTPIAPEALGTTWVMMPVRRRVPLVVAASM